MPEDSTFLGILEVSVEQKLDDVQDMIINMDKFKNKEVDESCLRLREKQSNMFFGKIFRAK